MSKILNLNDLIEKSKEIRDGFVQKAQRYNFSHINLNILEGIKIPYFGEKTAVAYAVKSQKHPDGSVTLIPFTPNTLELIYHAIVAYKTNWSVAIQKDQIRISAPQITTEAKKKLEKELKIEWENSKIGLRQLRHDLLKLWKNQKDLSETKLQQQEKKLQNIFDEESKKLSIVFQEQIKRINNF